MIPAPVRTEILARIRAAEAEHRVRVLLAIESGSRAWGFESSNSDFDARFIYVHPRDWYLSVGLEEQRDVIEYPIVDDIDLNGWDLRKALRLFRNSNPAFVEWIQSPIVYLEHGPFASTVRQLLPEVYSCTRGLHHYRNMARNNFKGYATTDFVPPKKYLYVLRPLLAARWLEERRVPAPVEFAKLLSLIGKEHALVADINAMLERKRAGVEMGLEPRIATLDAFIRRELDRIESVDTPTEDQKTVTDKLDQVFRDCLEAQPTAGVTA